MSRFVRHVSRVAALSAAGLIGSVLGCGIDRPPPPPPSLREVKLAKDFTLSTTRSVRVGITADDALFGARPDATVVLARPNGATLFRGAMKKGKGLEVTLPLAVDIQSVDVRVGGGDGVRRYNVSVDDETKSLVGHLQ
jgi:hypothetical protein